jgi:hypothetical protein
MMKRLCVLCLVLLSTAILVAQERATLTVPEVKTNSQYRVSRLMLDWDGSQITIDLTGTNGETKTCSYLSATATTMMTALNKANLTTRSLNQRIFDRIIADGCIAATVTGSVP